MDHHQADLAQRVESGKDRVGPGGPAGHCPDRDRQPLQIGLAAGFLAGRDHRHDLVDHATLRQHARRAPEHGLATQRGPLLGDAGAKARASRRQDSPHALAANHGASTGLALPVLSPDLDDPSTRPATIRPPETRPPRGPWAARRTTSLPIRNGIPPRTHAIR